jgi:xanthine dehydrogenase molybdopterin-binding subunit B
MQELGSSLVSPLPRWPVEPTQPHALEGCADTAFAAASALLTLVCAVAAAVAASLLLQEGAALQASGEAMYSGDEPLAPNALYAAYVTSKVAAGKLAHVDWQPALTVAGEVLLTLSLQ